MVYDSCGFRLVSTLSCVQYVWELAMGSWKIFETANSTKERLLLARRRGYAEMISTSGTNITLFDCSLSTRLYTCSVHEPYYRSQPHMIWLLRHRNVWRMWSRSSLPRHMGAGLVFELIVIKVFWVSLIFLDCAHDAMQRSGVFQYIVSTRCNDFKI
jgi:hypothetical protein